MRMISRGAILTLSLLWSLSQRCFAAAPPMTDAKTPTTAAVTPAKLTVAILDFQATMPGNADLGQQVSETLLTALAGEPGYTLVDRSSLARTLQEHELNLSGLVNTDQATKIGKLVGARILISGKIFALDKQIFITAKLVGVETSLVDGIVVKGSSDAEIGPLVMQLAERLARRIPESGPRLIASEEIVFDPLPGLRKQLAGRKLPKVAVHVAERHVAGARAPRADPAAETEIRQLLTRCGFTVIQGDPLDDAKAGVQVTITGEAFSEFAARIGNLYSCTDRVEIKVMNVSDKALLHSDRDSNRAVDLAENLAAKTALQKSGRILGIRILRHFADTLPAK